MMEKVYLHADLDAFFASVEQLDHPEYRGKPVIVSGLPGDRRCVVSTASYEARKFGVHSAMPAKTAFQLCPNGIFVRPDMKRYHEKSHEVMSIFRQYSPDVIQMSVDEAFIDLTGTERLLGPAEETARRIKQQVKEETGLTISIGMASTMYLAKIASGYRKPDGLTIIRPGDEEKFMLSLPLNKLWGAGEKTLERLNKAGFRTTQQIYDKTEGLLQGIFGENTGSFLYNSVRGNKDLIFGAEAENHSISSEKTFEYDLTDRDAIETALLQLAHTVMFRLHRENVHSRTLALKIRYDDFTTVSIQQTSERNFSSVDDLFERCCRLFYKKYNKESGIRLLGVTADKVEDNSVPSQKELFDFGEEKKSKIEKTIMNLEDRLPGVKIQKARTLHKAIILLPLLFLLAGIKSPVYAQESSDDEEIVFFKQKDSLFELKAKGFWEADISSGIGSTFGNGKSFSASFITPVFTQKIDLTLTAQFNKNFYFEGKFADSFDRNTVAAVYRTDGFFRELRIANRGIVFPSAYSVSNTGYSIGGGQNLAPGISLHLENERFVSDTVLRYEMLSQKSKTFYGMNSVTSIMISPEDYIRGKEFVLSDSSQITDIDSIYVENAEGTFIDLSGKKYKKLSSSEYLLNALRKTITFTQEAGTYYDSKNLPSILLTFKSSGKAKILSELGSYSESDSFLGKIQSWFNEADCFSAQDLSRYSFDLFTTVDGHDALILQKGAFFSPFAVCSRYDAGFVSNIDALVINGHSLSKAEGFTVSNSVQDDSRLILTVKSSDTEDCTLPEYRYPFASTENAFYLNGSITKDYSIEARTYSPVTNYYIGTGGAEGTVCVYINELEDTGASYSPETGIVTPSVIVNSQDKVLITWNEDNPTASYGTIAFANAEKFIFTDTLSSDISLTGRWSLPGVQSYASSADSYSGFIAATAGIKFKGSHFYAENTFTSSLENSNTTGIYRLLSMDDSSEKQNYLSENSCTGIPKDTDISLIKRDYTGTEILLAKENNCSSQADRISTDSEVSGYVVPVEWDFSSFKNSSSEEYAWAAKQIDLGVNSTEICSSDQFSIALYTPSLLNEVQVYLQLGVGTWRISRKHDQNKAPGVIYGLVTDSAQSDKPLSQKWQQVTVQLTDADKTRLIENSKARLIVIQKISTLGESSSPSGGILFAGPWSVNGTSFSLAYDSSFVNVRSFQYDSTAAEGSVPDDRTIRTFNKAGINSVQSFRWNMISPKEDFSDRSNIVKFTKYFESASLDSYERLNFYFKYNPLLPSENSSAQFTDDCLIAIDFYSESNSSLAAPAVHLEISSEQAELLKGTEWHKASLNLKDKTLLIDGNHIESGKYVLTVNGSDSVCRTDITLNLLSKNSSCIYGSGLFEIDEIYLSDTETGLINKDRLKIGYTDKDNPLTVNGTMLFGNIDFSLDATGVSSKNLSSDKKSDLSAKGNAKLSFDSLNISYLLNAELNYSSANVKHASVNQTARNLTGLSLFNYSVKTISPLFKTLSLSTDFTSNQISASDSASSSIDVSLSQINIPLTFRASTKANSSLWSSSQNASSSLNLSTKHYSLNASADFSQKTPSEYTYGTLDENFAAIQKNAFSLGRYDALSRTELISVRNAFSFVEGKIKPSVTFKTDALKAENFKDTVTFVFDMPVNIDAHTFSFGWNKSSSGEKNNLSLQNDSSAYAQDISFAAENIAERSWFWKTLPAADLFIPGSNETADFITLKNNSSYYLTWSKQISYTIRDLFIPAGASVSFARETLSSTTVSDYYLVKMQTLFTALNVFGKYGSSKLFDWYEQDYFSTIFTANIKIPKDKPQNFTPGFNISIDDSFYLSYDGLLQFSFDTYFEKKNNYSINSFITYKRKAESSPLILLIALFTDKVKPSSTLLTRKDNVTYQFIKSQNNSLTDSGIQMQHKALFTHTLEASVNKYFTVDTSISASYSVNENGSMSCGIMFALGGKLNF